MRTWCIERLSKLHKVIQTKGSKPGFRSTQTGFRVSAILLLQEKRNAMRASGMLKVTRPKVV